MPLSLLQILLQSIGILRAFALVTFS